jgi:hypothetical protein
MRWAGYVACVGERGIHIGFWWESRKKYTTRNNIDVDGMIILTRILEKQTEVEWTRFIWLRIGTGGVLL